MDLQSFIQSGLLEAYLLGQCSAEESALVERMAAGHAEVRTELSAVEQALEGYASANAVTPPAWMKGRILDVIESESARPIPPTSFPATGFSALRLFQLIVLALALLAGFFFFQRNSLTSEKTVLENRIAELQRQVDDCVQKGQAAESLKAIVLLLRHRDTRAVPLRHSNGTSIAYYNATSGTIALDINTLPAPPSGKHFQFWAIGKDPKQPPISAGMVDLQAENGWQTLRYVENAATLAISEEIASNESPSPDKVVMGGGIPAGE